MKNDPNSEFSTALDRGIEVEVLVLREGGIETFESCEGGDGHAFPEPTVRFHGNTAEGMKAVSVALNNGLKVAELRRYWSVQEGELRGPWWEMTFTAPANQGGNQPEKEGT